MLAKSFSRQHFEIIFLFFSLQKIGLTIHGDCLLSPCETVCMKCLMLNFKETPCIKCQILFAGKSKKNVLNAELFITKTCLYNFDPLKPHFHIVKLGFTLFFLFLLKNIDCGYSLELPR